MNDRETTGGGSRLNREATASLVWRLDALLWLVVPGTIAGFLSDEALSAHWPDLASLGEILGILCSVVYGLLLLSLAKVNGGYRAAGACTLFVVAAGVIVQVLGGSGDPYMKDGGAMMVALLSGVAALVGECAECTSHAEVLEPVDMALSQRWRRLMKWYVGLFLGTFAGILVALFSQWLGLLVITASTVGSLVVAILKLVYLWRTARTFREYEEMEA